MAIRTKPYIVWSLRAICGTAAIRFSGCSARVSVGRLITAVRGHTFTLAPQVKMIARFGDSTGERNYKILVVPLGKMRVVAGITGIGILVVPGKQEVFPVNKGMDIP